MTTNKSSIPRRSGTLRAIGGRGIIRLEDRFPTDVEELWSALTDAHRLSRWLGDIDGDLRNGGDFRARFHASGWEGDCHVEVCEPLRRLVLRTRTIDQPDGRLDVTLTSHDADRSTTLVVEDQGVPLDQIAAYGAGDQIHLEDLASHLAGRTRCDARTRWQELHPAYQQASIAST